MGKGDKKTAKGKRYTSSYGNSRTRSGVKLVAVKKPVAAVKAAPAKKAAPARKKP